VVSHIIIDGVHNDLQTNLQRLMRRTGRHLRAIRAVRNLDPLVAVKPTNVEAKQVHVVGVILVIVATITLTQIDPINPHIVADDGGQTIFIDADRVDVHKLDKQIRLVNLALVFKSDDVSASNRTFFNVDELHILAENEFVSNFDAGFHVASILDTFFN
jgi:hypothetical protein